MGFLTLCRPTIHIAIYEKVGCEDSASNPMGSITSRSWHFHVTPVLIIIRCLGMFLKMQIRRNLLKYFLDIPPSVGDVTT